MHIVLPAKPTRIVVISDLHLPFHDPVAVKLAIKLIELVKPKIIILNGDIIDHHGIRKFTTIPKRKTHFATEVDINKEFLKKLIEKLKNLGVEKLYWIEGNHEFRLKRFLIDNAPELYEIDKLALPQLYDISKDVTYVEREHTPCPVEKYIAPTIQAGPLHITHGDLFKSNHNVINIARTHFLKLQVPMLIGHWHRNDRYLQTSYEGKISGFWVQGCLCLPRPEYDAGKIWGQGVAIIDLYNNNLFNLEIVDFIRINNDKLVATWNGTKIEEKRDYKNNNIYNLWFGIDKNVNSKQYNKIISDWVKKQL